mmetsp:Transcript_21636/g.48344  ORF Transcript_21636/g.48344 Transcript_21636/m.48344 type:complete len:456 (+) Transcript_21636:59-1426(+)
MNDQRWRRIFLFCFIWTKILGLCSAAASEEDICQGSAAAEESDTMATNRRRNHHPSRADFEGGVDDFVDQRNPRVAPALVRTDEELEQRRIGQLPCQADEFFGQKFMPSSGWNPLLKAILQGTRSSSSSDGDDSSSSSPLSLLRTHANTLVRHIFSYLGNPYAKHVRLTLPADLVGNGYNNWLMKFVRGRGHEPTHEDVDGALSLTSLNNAQNGFVAFARVGNVTFPPPAGRNVNMMPIVLGDIDSLPEDLQPYYPLIDSCPFVREELGQIAYLTVHESFVDAGATQRRPGLHIESPGVFPDPIPVVVNEGETAAAPPVCAFTPAVEHPWGMGMFFGPDHYEGGIYFASNVDQTSQVFDALVDRTVPGIIDRHGGCEHLRPLLQGGTPLQAGDLVWMTDCTPHEALPQAQAGPRQFFRLVMPYISHWFADHSTPNPKVPLPDSITVLHGDKFQNA